MAAGVLARELQQGLQGEVRVDEPLAPYTTWRIGGPADLLARPQSREDLEFCLEFSRQKSLPLHIMGNGSNLLIRDGGVRGMVIQTGAWGQVEVAEPVVRCSAGVLMARVLKAATAAGLGGLEFMAGIPATAGGAAVTNAGTPEGCLGDVIQGAAIITPAGGHLYLASRDIDFAYRYSSLRRAGTVIAVDLQLAATDPRAIRERVQANLARRRARQPLEWPNAGSVFKNPPGHYAGRLIEAAGASGWQVGPAQVATKHANFIINRGRARAADVLELINRIQEAVARSFGINLELEVEVWGE